ncbi:RWD domain-containing protein 2B [Ostrinia furnacalis]|uniref:RWD domain-containing protein 2B n=1 Tax=Ostrinia furnacalis TaxID=93504 RepID=UPI00103D217F|nr:RWD domain-containing protein 2B [Ostrinia furnacalis]
MSTGNVTDDFVGCLTQQLSEFELLKSMYPNNNDIVLTDNKSLDAIQNFLDNPTEYTPSHLDFTINLFIKELKLEMCINLPSLYPEEEPDIFIRCNQLNRHQETKLNYELSNFIKTNHLGEVCLYDAISWLQENIENFYAPSGVSEQNTVNEETADDNIKDRNYVRLWIYSHHIYNKKKREEVVKKARELKLTGFCLSGKPGIVCIEGHNCDCYEWWKDIKSMNWKNIVIRKSEDFSAPQNKFVNFEEIQLSMTDFSKYMDKLGFSQTFNELFGLINDK